MATHRCIAHFDLDAFFVSVERIRDPSLVGKPLIVGGSRERGVVSACSYETRKFGVHSAMPMHQALRLCPEAIVVKGGMGNYGYYSRLVTTIIQQEMPLVQKASIDEFYADMTGMDSFYNCFRHASNLRRRIMHETGLPVSFALATNKIVSKIATNECKPNGEIQVLPGTERLFLSPLPIEKVPMVGTKSALFLKANGIYTIGDILQLSTNEVLKQLGKSGLSVHSRLNGLEESPVQQIRQKKSISCENTLRINTNDESFLQQELVKLVAKVGYELREDNKLAASVGVKIKYGDFRVVIHQCQIEPTSYDHILIKAAKELFRSLYIKGRLVRLVGVRLSSFYISHQIRLFAVDNHFKGLYREMDKLKEKYGNKIINRVSTQIVEKAS